MAKTIFDMRNDKNQLELDRKSLLDWIDANASDPAVKMEDIEAKQAQADELTKRINILAGSIKREEDIQKSRLAVSGGSLSEKETRIKAKADFYRAAMMGGDIAKAYEGLGAIPTSDADLGTGEKLLPTTMSNELLVEPMDINPLRNIVRITNITGLEEPKLGFTIEDADIGDVTDKQTANEIAMEGDSIKYGRLKMKVVATIKDTVMHGTDLDIVSQVEAKLRSAIAKREKLFAFQSHTSIYNSGTPDSAHRHMSFYDYTSTYSADSPTYVIPTKTGATMYAAIVNALADLADDYAANARVVMKKSDYYAMIQTLANHSDTLFSDKPASILGYPVTFCENATIPVVGDFSYYGINYDIGTIFETDKDAKKGEYYFVLTAWGDQQIRMKSAFRLAIVTGE